MIQRCIRTTVAIAFCGAASAAMAQQPAPAATSAAAAAPVPRHSCSKPGEYPGNLASDKQKLGWQ
jgi:hypothetical protein